MTKANIGLIGLAVMGENLVLNMANHGFTVAVYNRTTRRVDEFVDGRGAGKTILKSHSVAEFCRSLERPRRIMIMVRAGAAVPKPLMRGTKLCAVVVITRAVVAVSAISVLTGG
mgnify:CR=1 FL=1